jgi:sugar/nucleoside kinase (ribokinase family)
MPGVPLVIGLGDPVVDECVDCDHGVRGGAAAAVAARAGDAPRPPVHAAAPIAAPAGPRPAAGFLAALKAHPGGCTCVEPQEMAALQAATAPLAPPTRVPGGSAANVLKGLARLSGGDLACQLLGMVGADDAGALYTEQLRCHGVEPVLLVGARGGGQAQGGQAAWRLQDDARRAPPHLVAPAARLHPSPARRRAPAARRRRAACAS